jgi:transposase
MMSLARRPAMDVALYRVGDFERLERLIACTRQAKQRDRYRMVLLALKGWEAHVIAEALSSNRRTVQNWVYRYRDRGIDGLTPGKSKGHPPRLDPSRNAEFVAPMQAGPREGDGVCTLRAKEARAILEREFGVVYTVKSVYDLMHRLGLSCLKPRPRHEHSDPEAMRKFKEETAPFVSRP